MPCRLPRYSVRTALVTALLFASIGVASATGGSPKSTLGSPLMLRDEGIFFVNASPVTSNFPSVPATGAPVPGTIVINQMYVHYRIPMSPEKLPIVLVHGGGLTGSSYETTPDGREGWATYFVRKGFSVYVVDFPGRGRAGFNPTVINQAKYESNAAVLPASINRTTAETAWVNFRFGPVYGTPYPNVLFPVDSMVSFGAQGVPGADSTLEGGSLQQAPAALAVLLDRIGPAIVVVHSQSGPFADALVALRPALVKGVINVEGSQNVTPTDAQVAAYKGIPDLELFGDFTDSPVSTGKPRYDARKIVVDRINAAGGKAAIVTLPELGLRGNTHMLMQDKNNLKIASLLVNWIERHVLRKGRH